MNVKRLKELLNTFPDDLEVLIVYKDNYGECIEDDYTIYQSKVNHCTYTTKWQSNVDFYSFREETCEYRDEDWTIGGKIVEVSVPTNKKDVVILEV